MGRVARAPTDRRPVGPATPRPTLPPPTPPAAPRQGRARVPVLLLSGLAALPPSPAARRNEQQREADLAPSPAYMDGHAAEVVHEFVTPQMRMIVTSWMCEVAAEYRLQQETLFLAVALLDRFLTVQQVGGGAAGGGRRSSQGGFGGQLLTPRSNHRPPPAALASTPRAAGVIRLRQRGMGGGRPRMAGPPRGGGGQADRSTSGGRRNHARPARPRPLPQGVPRTVLQLVAVSCIFLASKQEEVGAGRPPPHPACGALPQMRRKRKCDLTGAARAGARRAAGRPLEPRHAPRQRRCPCP